MLRSRKTLIAAALLLGLLVLFFLPGINGGAFASADAPPCDDATVEKTVLHIFNQHPQYVGRSGKLMTGLADVREVEFRRHPEVNSSANTRWCAAQGRFSGGETEIVYFDLFSTRTMLLPMYGVRPCFGRFDPVHKDCSFARPPQRRGVRGAMADLENVRVLFYLSRMTPNLAVIELEAPPSTPLFDMCIHVCVRQRQLSEPGSGHAHSPMGARPLFTCKQAALPTIV